MTILRDDVKLLASRVMDDVDEGGGAPTANEIHDGVSNEIFPDISEFDRAAGRVSLRKVFVAVDSTNTDTYLGANVIVAQPPSDDNVSVTIFDTASTFDERSDAVSRLEAYLFVGTAYPAFLFGNHISGQNTIMLFRRTDEVPEIGASLVLKKREGYSDETEQYVRVTEASTVLRTFTDETGDFTRYVMTLRISDSLRYDFPGFDVTRADPSGTSMAAKTGVKNVVVADAARYYGCVPLTEAVSLGAYTAKGSSIYTRLVPSAQTETAIASARMNQVSTALVSAGAAITQSITLAFTTSQSLFIGGSILPGTLTVVRDGTSLSDSNGALLDASLTQVGTVDYENGILALTTNVFGTGGGTHAVTYQAAGAPTTIEQSLGFQVTISNRSLSYVFTIEPVPARGSLQISYLSGGKWYVLRESGTGAIRGTESAYGAGTLNFTDGTVSVTLGALPDVGSSLIYQWAEQSATLPSTSINLDNNAKAYFEINVTGKTLVQGGVTATWGTNTLTDDGQGNLTGSAGSGTVNYTTGRVRVSPNSLPAPGTLITVNVGSAATPSTVSVTSYTDGGSNWTFSLPSGVQPGSVSITAYASLARVFSSGVAIPTASTTEETITIYDQSGVLKFNSASGSVSVGTINYSTGAVALNKTINTPYPHTEAYYSSTGYYTLASQASIALPVISRSAADDAVVSYTSAGGGSSATQSINADHLFLSVNLANAFTLAGVRFTKGSKDFVVKATGSVQRDLSPTTGIGTEVGNMVFSTGLLTFDSWVTGESPAITNWRGVQGPPVTGPYSPLQTGSVTFRTATAPIRPSSLSVLGTMTDGTTFNVAADSNGKINGTRVKGRINYEFGTVELYFCNPSAGSGAATVDLTFLGISGVTTVYADFVDKSTLRYNAVAYTYLPLDASIIGVDPVRLPTDGRVPIFRKGGFAVIGNKKTTTAATVSNGQTINCARTRLSRVRVIGNDGNTIISGYTADLEAGTVTFTSVSGYSQPVRIEHRVEDLLTIKDAQLDGSLDFTRAITHDYPVLDSYISSAMPAGDLHARVSLMFDQSTWTGTWSDVLQGSASEASYDNVAAPIVVTNKGALTERWYLQFTSTTAFRIVGEHVGVIGTGTINTVTAPLNPRTGVPYFTIAVAGWGTGWAIGNVLRLNTIGAEKPVWIARTVQQGPETVTDDSFTLLVRGDVNRP